MTTACLDGWKVKATGYILAYAPFPLSPVPHIFARLTKSASLLDTARTLDSNTRRSRNFERPYDKKKKRLKTRKSDHKLSELYRHNVDQKPQLAGAGSSYVSRLFGVLGQRFSGCKPQPKCIHTFPVYLQLIYLIHISSTLHRRDCRDSCHDLTKVQLWIQVVKSPKLACSTDNCQGDYTHEKKRRLLRITG